MWCNAGMQDEFWHAWRYLRVHFGGMDVSFFPPPQVIYEKLDHYFNPYPTAFPYGNGMVLHFYQQQESSTTKTVHKVINKGLKTYV